MLPIPDTTVWSSSARLSSVRRRRIAATASSSGERGSSGSRAMCATGAGSRLAAHRGDQGCDREAAERALVDEPQLAGRRRRRRAGSAGASRPAGRPVATSICPLMPEVREHGVDPAPAIERQPQVLAPPTGRGDRARRPDAAAKSPPPSRCRRTARGWRTSTRAMVRPTTWSARPRRTTSTSGSSGTAQPRSAPVPDAASAVRVRQASWAAFCSASFLVRPSPEPQRAAADDRRGGEQLGVVRALFGDPVLGHAEAARGGQLLEAGLPVQAGAQQRGGLSSRGSKSRCTTGRAVSRPCSR